MADVWAPDLTQELQRAYDLTSYIGISGATGLSPVFLVGPGCDQAISRTHRFNFATRTTAGAGVSGGFGITVPVADARVAVIRSVNISHEGAASATWAA